jgi:hypothetical protein
MRPNAVSPGELVVFGKLLSLGDSRRHDLELPLPSACASVRRTEPAAHVADNPISAPGFGVRRRLNGGYTVGLMPRSS